MTVISFASLRGAPGVTTLACLVAATWPGSGPPIVVESDPCGGDLAARFGLSSRIGWSSFVTASRRAGAAVPIAPHLQQLPGGLDVLVGPGASEGWPSGCVDLLLVAAGSGDLIVDLGRLLPGEDQHPAWTDHSQLLVIMLDGDPASVWALHERAPRLNREWGQRVALVVKNGGEYSATAIASFTGFPVMGEVPTDPATAVIAAGGRGNRRRLSRSPLVGASTHLAHRLAGSDSGSTGHSPIGEVMKRPGRFRRVLGRRGGELGNAPDLAVDAAPSWPSDPPSEDHAGHPETEVAS